MTRWNGQLLLACSHVMVSGCQWTEPCKIVVFYELHIALLLILRFFFNISVGLICVNLYLYFQGSLTILVQLGIELGKMPCQTESMKFFDFHTFLYYLLKWEHWNCSFFSQVSICWNIKFLVTEYSNVKLLQLYSEIIRYRIRLDRLLPLLG